MEMHRGRTSTRAAPSTVKAWTVRTTMEAKRSAPRAPRRQEPETKSLAAERAKPCNAASAR